MARVLVTGAGGFIGSSLVAALQSEHCVIAVSREHGDIAAPETLEKQDSADHVFHLAARTFVPDAWADSIDFYTTNVVGTANVLAYCERTGASLTFVSAYVYGNQQKLPIDERTTPRPNNPYALSKYLAEQLCEFAASLNRISVTVVRPFNVYGPGQPARFLIPTIVRQVREGAAIRIKDLTPKRDYIHVRDLVTLLLATLQKKGPGYRVINAGSGESYSVEQLVDLVQSIAGTHLPVVDERTPRHAEINDVRADIALAREALGWSPSIPLRTGVKELLAGAGVP